MAGGGGNNRYSGVPSPAIETRIQQAREREQQRLDSDLNGLLQKYLAQYNDRDRTLTNDRLAEIEAAIDLVFDRVLMAGSVAKRTEVNGISDIDALVMLDKDSVRGLSSDEAREQLRVSIEGGLSRREGVEISAGRLAVTLRYRDGMEVQLLPAFKKGRGVVVPSGRGGGWVETDPKAFRKELTAANQRVGGGLVPAIKLLKAIVSRFPEQKQLSGYHVEALAVDAAKQYGGAATPKALLIALVTHASMRVLRPMSDRTGQSKAVDAYLGPKDSPERRNVAMALDGVRRRLETATSVAEWRTLLDDESQT